MADAGRRPPGILSPSRLNPLLERMLRKDPERAASGERADRLREETLRQNEEGLSGTRGYGASSAAADAMTGGVLQSLGFGAADAVGIDVPAYAHAIMKYIPGTPSHLARLANEAVGGVDTDAPLRNIGELVASVARKNPYLAAAVPIVSKKVGKTGAKLLREAAEVTAAHPGAAKGVLTSAVKTAEAAAPEAVKGVLA